MPIERPAYTILMLPASTAGNIRRFRIEKRYLRYLSTVFGVCCILIVLGIWYCGRVIFYAKETSQLRHENFELATRLRAIENEVARIDENLQKMNQVADRVQAVTTLQEGSNNLDPSAFIHQKTGKTPEVLYLKGERIDYEDEAIDSRLALRMVDGRLSSLAKRADQTQNKIQETEHYLAEHAEFLTSTPTIWPVDSHLVVSPFGPRIDAHTDIQVMHKGIDLAAQVGTTVQAPARGVVVFVGHKGPLQGKVMILDHGFGIQTHYGLLGEIHVHPGDHVRRGDILGEVGKVDEGTGIHLHYEVRYNGIPQDPENFIWN
jgi:murein DD-endopeptidase MepM/ murein hydrolase activator NlpD